MARDMTEKQFQDALRRNGFRPANGPFGSMYFQSDGIPNTYFPGVVRNDGGMDRRATIASLIARRDARQKAEV